MSQTLECPNCGAAIDYVRGDDPVVRCRYCQTTIVIPDELLSPSVDQSGLRPGPAWGEDLFQPEQIANIQEIGRLAREGNKVEAIKLYRQVFGTGLKESKEAVEAIQAGNMAMIYYDLEAAQDPLQVEAEVARLLRSGDKIGAVRYYRQVTQQGLKVSKDAVDEFERSGTLRFPRQGSWLDESTQGSNSLAQANHLVAIVELVAAGDKVGAIAAYQQSFGASLVEAQEAVELISRGVTADSAAVSVQTISFTPRVKGAAAATAGVLGGFSCLSVLGVLAILLVTVVPVMFALASPGGPLEGVWNRLNPFAYARVVLAFGEQGSGPGYLDDPRGIAIAPDGSLFVASYGDGRVQKFDSSGMYRMLWNIGPQKYISSMAADRSGDVYMVYSGDIWKYDGESGQLLGKLADQLDVWFDAVVSAPDGGLIAAVNSEQIYRFDEGGALVFSIAQAPGTQTGDPDGVEDIAVDGLGNLYLLTDGETPVLVYSPQGRLLARFGGDGDEPGQLRAASAIEVDGQGNLYISDIKGIQVFSNDGRYLDKIETQGFAHGLAFDPQGALWAVSNLPKVFKYQIARR